MGCWAIDWVGSNWVVNGWWLGGVWVVLRWVVDAGGCRWAVGGYGWMWVDEGGCWWMLVGVGGLDAGWVDVGVCM